MRSASRASQQLRTTLDATQKTLDETRNALNETRVRFANIVDVDAEKARIETQIAERRIEIEGLDELYRERSLKAEVQHEASLAELGKEIAKLRADYLEKKAIYDRLLGEVAVFDERLAFAEMGVYEPHFEFNDSESYKTAIIQVREQQKGMITAKTSVFCTTNWTVDGKRV